VEIPALHCTRAWTARRTPNPGGLILPSDSQPSVRCGSCAEYLGAPLVGCWECGSANAVSMTLKLAHLYVGLFRWSTGKHMPGGEITERHSSSQRQPGLVADALLSCGGGISRSVEPRNRTPLVDHPRVHVS